MYIYMYIYIYIYIYIHIYISYIYTLFFFSIFHCKVLNTNAEQYLFKFGQKITQVYLDTQGFTLLRSSVKNKSDVRFTMV